MNSLQNNANSNDGSNNDSWNISSKNKKKFSGGELINTGIFTAIIAVITMLVIPLGFIPVLMPLYCFFIPILSGVPFILFLNRVSSFGMISIMSVLLGLFLLLTGMGWYALPLCIISGLLSDLVSYLGKYKNNRLNILAYSIFCLWVFGSYIPLIFMADEFWQQNQDYGTEFVETCRNIFQLWSAPILIVACMIFGAFGANLGVKMQKKHFQKSGVL